MDKRAVLLGASFCAITACSAPDEATPASGELTGTTTREVILDTRADGAILAGRLEVAPPRSDADRVIVLRTEGTALPVVPARVIDARFVEGGVAVLAADRVLRFHSQGDVVELDREVYGPLSIAGDEIAYVRGAPPDLELMRASVRTGVVEQLTRGMAPVWSPALESETHEVIFVSGVEGTPRLFRIDRDGMLHGLPPTERTPSAPTAPRWSGTTLVFEDEHGIAWLDLERGVIEREVRGAHGLSVLANGALAASIEGGPIGAIEGSAL